MLDNKIYLQRDVFWAYGIPFSIYARANGVLYHSDPVLLRNTENLKFRYLQLRTMLVSQFITDFLNGDLNGEA